MYKFTLFLAIFGFVVDISESFAIKQEELDWWQRGVFYQIYPRSFKDSNADGIGDLRGIAEKVNYIKDIGITAVWLNPIFESPLVDFGYDISNYTRIDPDFGNLDDLEYLKDALHKAGIRLLLDFVPNHTSDKHNWFQKSIRREDPFTNFYVWHDGIVDANGVRRPPTNWRSQFGYPAWSWNDQRKQYYLHQFHFKQPDLNYNNKELVKEMVTVLKFWLDRGVDGFRMDAVTYMYEDPEMRDEELLSPNGNPEDYWAYNHSCTMDLPQTYKMITTFRDILDVYTKTDGKTRVMLTEAYTSIDKTMQYYKFGGKPGAHMPFNFLFITAIDGASPAKEYQRVIQAWMTNMPEGHWPNWVIGNHDNHRLATRYGTDLVDGLNMMGMLLPGTGITYYGDEIGMEDASVRFDEGVDPQACDMGKNLYPLVTRDPERTPFQWDNSLNAAGGIIGELKNSIDNTQNGSPGFSSSLRTWLPVNSNYWRLNLKEQMRTEENSHYKVYKRLMDVRKTDTMLYGRLETHVLSKWVFSFMRYLNASDTYVVIINLGSETAPIDLSAFMSNLPEVMTVHTGSINARYMPGEVVSTNQFFMRPKASLLLTTAKEVPGAEFKASGASSITLTSSISTVLLFLSFRLFF